MSNTLVKAAKHELRTHIKCELAKLSSAVISLQSEKVFSTIISLESFRSSKRIAIFMNMPTEVETLPIIQRCFIEGKEVFLPQCIHDSQQLPRKHYLKMRKLLLFQDVLDLRPQGKYGLLEPTKGEDLMETGCLDLIIVPGIAFNHKGERIGHGVGYYDNFLTHYTSQYPRPYTLGIGLKPQLVKDIPVEPHDFTLDSVIIDGDLIKK